MIREEMVRMEEQDSPPSSLSSRHSHEDDEDKMPEEALMKYTKDSRAGSPAPTTTVKVQYKSIISLLSCSSFRLRRRKQRRRHRSRWT